MPNKTLPDDTKIIVTQHTPKHTPTASGYSGKIPTRFMAMVNNRAHRVYAGCYSNVASFYVLIKGQRVYVNDYILDLADQAAKAQVKA